MILPDSGAGNRERFPLKGNRMRKTLLALVVVAGLATAGCIFAPQGSGAKNTSDSECAAACAASCDAAAAAKAKSCGDDCSKPCCADK